ncbi:5 10-methylenetetrahydrofolate reductase-like protein, partial [Marine Group I thaumarchaeote SCGC AAA799-E16]
FAKLAKKKDARPKGFMTQVVQNTEQVQALSDNLKEFSIIPIILFPSQKNEKSAKFLGLDLESYSKEFEELLRKSHEITGDVLLTSPNDFTGLNEFLGKTTF